MGKEKPSNDVGYLFIGGCSDGRRINVPNLPFVKVPVYEEQSFLLSGKSISPNLKIETYREEKMKTPLSLFTFYVFESMPIESAIARLIKHYQPNLKGVRAEAR